MTHVRLFLSRIKTLLIRSGLILKIVITCVMLITISSLWFVIIYYPQQSAKSQLVQEINDLTNQKSIFENALAEYTLLNHKNNHQFASHDFKQVLPTNYCKLIVDQARRANLNLISYSSQNVKEKFKQLIFNFVGSYAELLFFLEHLDQAGAPLNFQKIRITTVGHKLQIAYVCGIHTFVK